MSWRGVLTLVLLAAAIVTGWSAWRQRAEPPATATASARPDYVLHDFELVAPDQQRKEAFTMREPELTRSHDDRTLSIATPLFLIPDADDTYRDLRSNPARAAAHDTTRRVPDEG